MNVPSGIVVEAAEGEEHAEDTGDDEANGGACNGVLLHRLNSCIVYIIGLYYRFI